MPQRCPEYRYHTDSSYRCHRNECPFCGPIQARRYYDAFEQHVQTGRWIGLTFTLSTKAIPQTLSFEILKPMIQAALKRARLSRKGWLGIEDEGYLGVIDVHASGWAHAHVMVKLSDDCDVDPEALRDDMCNYVNRWSQDQLQKMGLDPPAKTASMHLDVLEYPGRRWFYHCMRKLRPWTEFPQWPYPSNYRAFFTSRNLERSLKTVEETIDIL